MDHMFDHEKLDVYSVELAFIRWLTDFLEEVSEYPAAQRRELVDQLDRASMSALFNTAEGKESDKAVRGRSSSMTPAVPLWNAQLVLTPPSQSRLPQTIVSAVARRCWLG
jgi:hypothetical protein